MKTSITILTILVLTSISDKLYATCIEQITVQENVKVQNDTIAQPKVIADAKAEADRKERERIKFEQQLQNVLSGKINSSGPGPGSSIGNHTLAGRSMVSKPSLVNTSKALGKITIRVTVDKNGNVTSADFNNQGSTTNDAYLIQLSIAAAKKIKFSPSPTGAEEQFGTVPFNYTP